MQFQKLGSPPAAPHGCCSIQSLLPGQQNTYLLVLSFKMQLEKELWIYLVALPPAASTMPKLLSALSLQTEAVAA